MNLRGVIITNVRFVRNIKCKKTGYGYVSIRIARLMIILYVQGAGARMKG